MTKMTSLHALMNEKHSHRCGVRQHCQQQQIFAVQLFIILIDIVYFDDAVTQLEEALLILMFINKPKSDM